MLSPPQPCIRFELISGSLNDVENLAILFEFEFVLFASSSLPCRIDWSFSLHRNTADFVIRHCSLVVIAHRQFNDFTQLYDTHFVIVTVDYISQESSISW